MRCFHEGVDITGRTAGNDAAPLGWLCHHATLCLCQRRGTDSFCRSQKPRDRSGIGRIRAWLTRWRFDVQLAGRAYRYRGASRKSQLGLSGCRWPACRHWLHDGIVYYQSGFRSKPDQRCQIGYVVSIGGVRRDGYRVADWFASAWHAFSTGSKLIRAAPGGFHIQCSLWHVGSAMRV